MLNLIEQAIAANKEYPHLDNHQIVLEIASLEKQVIDLQKAVSLLLSDKGAEKE